VRQISRCSIRSFPENSVLQVGLLLRTNAVMVSNGTDASAIASEHLDELLILRTARVR
jgi:hypothetical protein